MKVTLKWLRQYVEFYWSLDELAARPAIRFLDCEAGTTPGDGLPTQGTNRSLR